MLGYSSHFQELELFTIRGGVAMIPILSNNMVKRQRNGSPKRDDRYHRYQ